MSPSAIDPAAAHEPPHRFVENEGYVALPVQASTADTANDGPEETNAEDDAEQDEDFDDLFEPSDDGYSDTELQASNPSDYTKAYNRQRRNNDNAVPESQKPKANPQLNTRAAVDDHIKSLSAHTAKLKLSNSEAGLGGKGHGGAEKSDRATSEQVLDPRTRMILLQMLNRNIVSEINGVISTGKEANVYHSTTIPQSEDAAAPLHRAIKVYKTSILVFKDRDKYVSGEHRFKQGYNKSSNRAKVKVWAEKEYRNLRRLHAAGIPCPEPLYLRAHVLVMSFLGSGKGVAAPRLRDVQFEEDSSDLVAQRWREVYVTLLTYMRMMYQICHLVHADLSEYNLLYHSKQLYMIDVSQSVEHDHPRSLEFLRMDIKNVSDFFTRKGVNTLPERRVFDFVTSSHGGRDLTAMSKTVEDLLADPANAEDVENGTSSKDVDNEVFRQQYIPQNLQQVFDIERDAETIHEGKGESLVYKNLLAPGTDQPRKLAGDAEASGEGDTGTDDDDGGSSGDEEPLDENGEPIWVEREDGKPRGKRFEDKEERKAHKLLVKEEKREKRTTKLPKHMKKKLISQGSRGKK
ncbi:hypothetical protein B0A48_15749 [Cryoendolithus antarcticus]|uniref:Serine/threonine-protein kinase RIO1 n=1 Tax=Cryoendolithus antarcticus TaxID=1507870 RepID=A0A1V8SH69_9PEZI|nr:hypothetical protein B0A48_15749 [Cryoendolithus antarcticus]